MIQLSLGWMNWNQLYIFWMGLQLQPELDTFLLWTCTFFVNLQINSIRHGDCNHSLVEWSFDHGLNVNLIMGWMELWSWVEWSFDHGLNGALIMGWMKLWSWVECKFDHGLNVNLIKGRQGKKNWNEGINFIDPLT